MHCNHAFFGLFFHAANFRVSSTKRALLYKLVKHRNVLDSCVYLIGRATLTRIDILVDSKLIRQNCDRFRICFLFDSFFSQLTKVFF